jgi:hypothetical protein
VSYSTYSTYFEVVSNETVLAFSITGRQRLELMSKTDQ